MAESLIDIVMISKFNRRNGNISGGKTKAFLVDITNHLNVLNTRLQGKNQLISQLYAHVSSFQCNLTLFRSQFNSENYNHFPNYKKMAEKFNKTAINVSYVEKLDILIQSFQDRFSEFKKVKPLLDILSNPFTISVENAPESMQLEIIDIQTTKIYATNSTKETR
ncbi:unnamed protein product [Diatraea saccharalis]|uniref:General transcription factor II-I repeat domain-containing protein 2 n=1 Tax=Diatraea saccharalis TaxID=40085 RepID=A0A9N9QWR0_9NEOP|nr:unnamed protein product [Diatraea saccharalis]